jgi:cell division protein FtsI/penicillin-binding protein 2
VHHQEYRTLADKQHIFAGGSNIRRGAIFIQDKDGVRIPAAVMGTEKALVANPRDVDNVQAAVEFLSREFSLDVKETTEKISKKNDSYEVLARNIDVKKAQILISSLPKGIFFENKDKRVYPHGVFASHILGFTSQDQQELRGRYGLERFYDESLSGKKGFFESAPAYNAVGFWLGLGRRIISPPEWGAQIVSTIDYNIQRKAEEVLTGLREKWSPVSGLVLVTNPRSGKILAEAAFPSFDPNDYGKVKDFYTFLNPAAEAAYEFGSVIKPIIMAAAIEEGLVGPNTTYYDSGELRFGSYTIRNFDLKAYHTQTMTQVLEKSLNTGAVFVGKLLGGERQLQYLKRFGFGEKTDIDLPGEVRGNLSNLSSGRDINFATASFGQGISATPIQLALAIGAIANNGILMKPYAVEKVVDGSGNETLQSPKE